MGRSSRKTEGPHEASYELLEAMCGAIPLPNWQGKRRPSLAEPPRALERQLRGSDAMALYPGPARFHACRASSKDPAISRRTSYPNGVCAIGMRARMSNSRSNTAVLTRKCRVQPRVSVTCK